MKDTKKVRSRNVNKILKDDYTLSAQDFYPPQDNREIQKSELIDIYDGKVGAYFRHREQYNRFLEKEEIFDKDF